MDYAVFFFYPKIDDSRHIKTASPRYWITLDMQFPPMDVRDIFDEATMFNINEHGYVYLSANVDAGFGDENGFFMCDLRHDAFFESYMFNLVCTWLTLYFHEIGAKHIKHATGPVKNPAVYPEGQVIGVNVQIVYSMMKDFMPPHYFRVTGSKAELSGVAHAIKRFLFLLTGSFSHVHVTEDDVVKAHLPAFIHTPRHRLVHLLLCVAAVTGITKFPDVYKNSPAPWFMTSTKAVPHRSSHFVTGVHNDV